MEQEWIGRASRGDEKAFGYIVDSYKRYLMAVVLPIVGNADQAQDVLQETFWQAYRSLPAYRGGSFKFWLARIATNKALDFRRQQEKDSRTINAVAIPLGRESSLPSAEEEYFRRMAGEKLTELVSGLPPPYQLTLSGYLLEGKSYRELAEESGITVKTVESRLYRARQILKKQLKEGV